MKITLPLLTFVFFFFFFSAQVVRPSSAITHKSSENSPVKASNNQVIPFGTICFSEKGNAELITLNKTNFNFSVKKFSNKTEADSFVSSFKNSDSNILTVDLIDHKDDLYFFNFTVKEPKDTKWYLQLFKNNALEFIKYNKNIRSIDDLLSK